MPAKKQTKTTMALVVRQPPQSGRKRRRRNRRKPRRGPAPLDSVYRTYRLALRDPFCAEADGVRLPDMYRHPTTTQKIKVRIGLTSDASGTLAFQVFPQPFYCMQMFNGTTTGVGNMAANVSAKTITSPTSLSTLGFGAYRVVAWGFRLMLSDTLTSAKGIYTVAPVPVQRNNYLGYTTMNTIAFAAGRYPGDILAFPQPTASIETLPGQRTFNANDLQYQGDFMGVGVPYAPTCQDFRPLGNNNINPFWSTTGLYGTTRPIGNLVVGDNPPSCSVFLFDDYQPLDMTGNIGYVVYGTGLPASTAELSVELVYHLELTPTPSSSVVGVYSSTPSPVGQTAVLERLYSAIKDSMFLGKHALNVGANLGMLGLRYANRNRQRYIEVD